MTAFIPTPGHVPLALRLRERTFQIQEQSRGAGCWADGAWMAAHPCRAPRRQTECEWHPAAIRAAVPSPCARTLTCASVRTIPARPERAGQQTQQIRALDVAVNSHYAIGFVYELRLIRTQ